MREVRLVKLIKTDDGILLVDGKNETSSFTVSMDINDVLVCEILEHETSKEYWVTDRYTPINHEHIQKIMNKNGLCYIEMVTYEGDYCGYREPKLKDGKIIIHL